MLFKTTLPTSIYIYCYQSIISSFELLIFIILKNILFSD